MEKKFTVIFANLDAKIFWSGNHTAAQVEQRFAGESDADEVKEFLEAAKIGDCCFSEFTAIVCTESE